MQNSVWTQLLLLALSGKPVPAVATEAAAGWAHLDVDTAILSKSRSLKSRHGAQAMVPNRCGGCILNIQGLLLGVRKMQRLHDQGPGSSQPAAYS